MSKINEYIVVNWQDIKDMLSDGYQPYGDPFIWRDNPAQAMVKFDNVESDVKPDDERIPTKAEFINERIKQYAQYWDDEKQIYDIDRDWKMTKLELEADIEEAWVFEYGSK